MASADLLLHPVRLRIVQAFLGEQPLTIAQLAGELKGVPLGSLYRHVALLNRAGVLQVVGERRVRAVVERTYMLRLAAARVGAAEAAEMAPEAHRQAFLAFVAQLLFDFDQYLAAGPPDLVRDGVSYGLSALWLTDAEQLEFLRDVALLLQPRLALAPAAGRRRRLVASLFLPAPEGSDVAAGRGASRGGGIDGEGGC